MKITRRQLRSLILESLNEAHGLNQADLNALNKFAETVTDDNIKRIIKFLTKSNVLVDKTQDVTKMKKKK
mgnify:CR=1 FL=1